MVLMGLWLEHLVKIWTYFGLNPNLYMEGYFVLVYPNAY
jgi:hypothetical protein